MRRTWTVVTASLAWVGCASGTGPSSSPAPEAGERATPATVITADELTRDLYAFADDSMRGRETGTPDATRAARFIGERLAALGLEPAGDSSYYQRVPLERDEFAAATRFTVSDGGASRELSIGSDLVPLVNLGAG